VRTNQEIFTNVVTNLLKQNAKSEGIMPSGSISCAYRGKNGMKCAAGWELPDEHYNPEFENLTVYIPLSSLTGVNQLVLKFRELGYTDDNLQLLRDLQYIHDQKEPYLWKGYFSDIAKEYHLTMPE